jgi:hypothetical protein
MGRFMTPDPAGMMAVDIGSPQTLNRYAYVVNNPLSLVDPFGLDCVYLNSGGTGVDNGGIDQNSNSGECGRTGGYWVEGAPKEISPLHSELVLRQIPGKSVQWPLQAQRFRRL